jgi:hypothetical protein
MSRQGEGLVRFDEALRRGERFARERLADFKGGVVLVRDLQGRIRIGLDDRQAPEGLPSPEQREGLAGELHTLLGAYGPGPKGVFLLASGMFDAGALFDNPDRLRLPGPPEGFYLLERNLMGSDWLREPFAEQTQAAEGAEPSRPPRVTFFGLKGGVGRSTAAAVWAWRLAQAGKHVLVLDLDLESPGLSATLLPPQAYPDYGIVDWLVESSVTQADVGLLREMVARSPLAKETEGRISVLPAGGRAREGYSYLPKLARAYGGANDQEFGDLIRQLIEQAETQLRPDITFLDSRAGLHDIAAVTITRLGAHCLLFAANTAQTWAGYEILFSEWHKQPQLAGKFRENLKTVAALVPETNSDAYLQDFRHKAYELFQRSLYEQAEASSLDAFNHDVNDPEAPHWPLRINWSRAAQQFDPVAHPAALSEPQLKAAFDQFVQEATLMVLGEDQT